MKLIADGSIDMILCDLPYGTTSCSWDSVIPFEPLWKQYRRIIKDRGAIVLTASQPFTTALIASNMEWFKYCWVWEKSICGDIFNAKNKPLKKHEDICVFSNGTTANRSSRRMPYYPQGLRSTDKTVKNKETVRAFFAPRPSHEETYRQTQTGYPTSILKFPNDRGGFHPTQKPIALFEYLIRTYTNPGEVVLDNCIGSGTTAIASINADRRYIGFETDAGYFKSAQERIQRHKRPPSDEAIEATLEHAPVTKTAATLDYLFDEDVA
jgi:site-specific DNA-methyltransferase (adenine-specific)